MDRDTFLKLTEVEFRRMNLPPGLMTLQQLRLQRDVDGAKPEGSGTAPHFQAADLEFLPEVEQPQVMAQEGSPVQRPASAAKSF